MTGFKDTRVIAPPTPPVPMRHRIELDLSDDELEILRAVIRESDSLQMTNLRLSQHIEVEDVADLMDALYQLLSGC